jgi:L-cysteine desulfidase
MTQLEKISSIVGLIVIGSSVFAHSISLQGDVGTLSNQQKYIRLNIEKNENILFEIKSYHGEITNKIENNRYLIKSLKNDIEKEQNRLILGIEKTYSLLSEISKK